VNRKGGKRGDSERKGKSQHANSTLLRQLGAETSGWNNKGTRQSLYTEQRVNKKGKERGGNSAFLKLRNIRRDTRKGNSHDSRGKVKNRGRKIGGQALSTWRAKVKKKKNNKNKKKNKNNQKHAKPTKNKRGASWHNPFSHCNWKNLQGRRRGRGVHDKKNVQGEKWGR